MAEPTPGAGTMEDGANHQPSSNSGPSPTSRIAVQKVHSVVVGLCEYKRYLVEEIGFAGVLLFPDIAKLNLKFSSWIMSKVDVRTHVIDLGPSYEPLEFFPQDFHKIFGIPDGPRNIYGPDAQISKDAVKFIRDCIGLSDKFSHSLKAAEAFVTKPLSEISSTVEKDCFKMAFVVFVMGHLLAPSTKHDYSNVDYWGALRETDNICRFNWCQYCFDHLLDAVTKLKNDTAAGVVQVNNLSGCHLFFQIFLLDNVDLGVFNIPHKMIPRAQHFDGVRLKQMIMMCSHKVDGASVYIAPPVRTATIVCYTRHNLATDELPPLRPILKASSLGPKDKHPELEPSPGTTEPNEHHPGGADFVRFLHQRYPALAATPIGCALKQHNARCLYMANQIKNMFVEENIRFAQKIVDIIVPTGNMSTPFAGTTVWPNQGLTPRSTEVRANRIQGRRLQWSPSEGDELSATAPSRRRVPHKVFPQSYVFGMKAPPQGTSPHAECDEEQPHSETKESPHPDSDIDARKRQKLSEHKETEQLDSSVQCSQYQAGSDDTSAQMLIADTSADAHCDDESPQSHRAETSHHDVPDDCHVPMVPDTENESTGGVRNQDVKFARASKAVDPPPFDLGFADMEEVNSPPKKGIDSIGRQPVSPRTATKTFSDHLVAQLLMVNDDIPDGVNICKFGMLCTGRLPLQGTAVPSFLGQPNGKSVAGRTHVTGVDQAIGQWIEKTTDDNLDRAWIVHNEPRYIAINGHCVKAQLHGGSPLDHELGSIVIRRLSQLDEYTHKLTPGRRHRLILEPDFATAALAGEDVTSYASVQKQFAGEQLPFSLLGCRYVTAVSVLPHGWCTFMWDMEEKELLVIDPLACQPDNGFRRNCLDYAADILHEALFNCLQQFYTQWHCSRKAWTRRFVVLTTTRFTSMETGMCMVHIIRHFDGRNLTAPMTKASVLEQSNYILVEVLHLEGNAACLQMEALECVANATHPAIIHSENNMKKYETSTARSSFPPL